MDITRKERGRKKNPRMLLSNCGGGISGVCFSPQNALQPTGLAQAPIFFLPLLFPFLSLRHINQQQIYLEMAPIAKRRRISPEVESPSSSPQNGVSSEEKIEDFYRNASGWNLEQDYENRPRSLKKKKEENRLPIKTSEGWVEQAPAVVEQKEEDADSFLGSGDEAEAVDDEDDDDEEDEKPEVPQISPREQILRAKEELARVASLISEDPEENIAQLKKLQVHATSQNRTVVKLCMATQLAIYRDIIPGYRIRPVSKEELKQKLSKDVRKMRNFEQMLVGGYHEYVRSLTRAAKKSGDKNKEAASVATVAISCACTLLNTVPHFNFRGDLINILVGRLSIRQYNSDFHKAVECLETLFRDDEDGNASREAVDLLCKMMKSRSYNIHESVLNTFLHLRLLSEFAGRSSSTRTDKNEDESAIKQKQKREFRTKKERKRLREVKGVEKEFREADATVSHEERDKNQSEMLKLVFVAYFRVLKQRVPQLMGAVLEGLARYAHLINQDFFGDILEALRELVISTEAAELAFAEEDEEAATAPRNINRESLLCIITAFALLQGQDVVKSVGSLHLDLEFFITHLYKTLLPSSMNPDLELSSKSLRLRDPDGNDDEALLPQQAKHKINVQTTTVLLLRSLSSVLLPPQNVRSVPPLRLAAFAKQLLTISLQLPEKSCLAMMGLLQQVAKVQGKKIAALWYTEERKGDGVFNPVKEEVEGSNPFATTVWEGELLRKHFCPQVRESIVALEKGVVASRS
jgi:nucleolar complex protein 3